MVAHAQAAYPNECCGAMLGAIDGENKIVRVAVPLDNAFDRRAGRPVSNCGRKICWQPTAKRASAGWI